MSDNVTVSPTPIQRNAQDVAMELFQYHANCFGVPEEDIQDTYAQYYALAKYLQSKNPNKFTSLLDPEVLKKISE
jgi:hypothetical protein